MKTIPMPSPRGTNHAGLFLDRRPAGAAYDEAPVDEDIPELDNPSTRLLRHLARKLSAEDWVKLQDHLRGEDTPTGDDIEDLSDNAMNGGKGGRTDKAMDAARRASTDTVGSFSYSDYAERTRT